MGDLRDDLKAAVEAVADTKLSQNPYLGQLSRDLAHRFLADYGPALLAAVEAQGWRPTHRHVKRGTDYEIIGSGMIQTDIPLADEAAAIIYRSDTGMIYVRRWAEWFDGRFETLPASPTQDADHG